MPKKGKRADARGSSAPAATAPDSKSVGREEVVSVLRTTGRGWSEDIPGILSLPEKLLMLRTDSGTFYSSDGRFAISGIAGTLGSERIGLKDSDYGIALYSTGGSVYFLLADPARGIIVRQRLFCIHDSPPEKDWASVKELILSSLEAAGPAAKEGFIIVADPAMRKVRLSG